jgi:hypothetical protein
MTELTRRAVLLSTATLGAAGLAGCVGDSDQDDPGNGTGDGNGTENGTGDGNGTENGTGDDNGTENGTGDDNGTENGTGDGNSGNRSGDSVVALETVDTDCAQGENDTVSIDRGEDVVTVLGATPAPNPCHEAVLDEGTVEGESFTLVIDVEDAKESGACQDCVGKVEYEARIDVEDPSTISEGTVRHVEGGTHGIAVEGDSAKAPAPSVRDASIETIDASCSTGEERERLVTASRTADGVAVEGVLQASDPCHRADLAGTSTTDGQLRVDVAPESTLGEGEVCQQCLGDVQYAVEVDLSNPSALSGVTVGHGGSDQFTFDAEDLDSE